MPFDTKDSLGLSFRFDVHVDGIDLGGWASCTGLKVDFELFKFLEGGPTPTPAGAGSNHYDKLTLTRAMTRDDSAKVRSGCPAASTRARVVPQRSF